MLELMDTEGLHPNHMKNSMADDPSLDGHLHFHKHILNAKKEAPKVEKRPLSKCILKFSYWQSWAVYHHWTSAPWLGRMIDCFSLSLFLLLFWGFSSSFLRFILVACDYWSSDTWNYQMVFCNCTCCANTRNYVQNLCWQIEKVKFIGRCGREERRNWIWVLKVWDK